MSSDAFLVQLDRTPHTKKPEGMEIAATTRRLQEAGPSLVTFEELRDVILSGGTWCGGCFEPKVGGWGAFVSQQIFALDLDNSAEYQRRDGSKGKRPLLPDEVGYITPAEALARCETLGLRPMMDHFTMHHDPAHNVRFRLVFDAGEHVTDKGRAEQVIATLLRAFPEADQKCSNTNRLWFGGSEVRDLRAGRCEP